MDYIDLHVHSNISDGTLTPTEVVKEAISASLSAFALTDHDSLYGLNEAKEAAAKQASLGHHIEVISGVEISCNYQDHKEIHIVGLMVDETNAKLNDALEQAIINRDNRNIKMIKNFNDAGIPIKLEDLEGFAPQSVITRAHFARYFVENGYVKTRKEAFEKYLDQNGPYYVPREFISPEDSIALIRQAGGIPVLAHPLLYHLSKDELDKLVSRLKEAGLVAIEAVYSTNTGCDESDTRRLARLNDLLLSGGSDFHGANKPDISIGKGFGNLKIPYEFLDEMRKYRQAHLI